MKTYTDEQLKRALAKMLPDQLDWREIKNTAVGTSGSYYCLCWKRGCNILDTELLVICHMIEQTLSPAQAMQYAELCASGLEIIKYCYYPGDECPDWSEIAQLLFLSWQQRTVTLAKVFDIEIV